MPNSTSNLLGWNVPLGRPAVAALAPRFHELVSNLHGGGPHHQTISFPQFHKAALTWKEMEDMVISCLYIGDLPNLHKFTVWTCMNYKYIIKWHQYIAVSRTGTAGIVFNPKFTNEEKSSHSRCCWGSSQVVWIERLEHSSGQCIVIFKLKNMILMLWLVKCTLII